MEILEFALAGISILLAALVAIFVRRAVISRRGGTIDMNLRLSTLVPGRGWAPGLARFEGNELRWYRLFSLGFRPRRVLLRDCLVIEERRAPAGPECLAMPSGWVILRCRGVGATSAPANSGRSTGVELALTESAYTGFLSWLEAAPPGSVRLR